MSAEAVVAVALVVVACGVGFVRGLRKSWRLSGGLPGMREAWRKGAELGRRAELERHALAERRRRGEE